MSAFEFLFSLLGLLMGFVLVEVLSGFVRVIKAARPHKPGAQPAVRVGWLTLLLALFVMLDVASYWTNVWVMRDVVSVGFDTVFGCLLIAGVYYFAASMVFPDDLSEWPDLDEWFWLNRRRVLLCIFAINSAWMTTVAVLSSSDLSFWAALVEQLIYFALVLIAALARHRRVVFSALGALIALYGLYAAATVAARVGWI